MNSYRTWFLILSTTFLLLFIRNTYSEEEKKSPVECSADYLEYDEINSIVFAKGNVKIKYKDINVTADEVKFNTKSSELSAKGNISVTEKDSIIKGEFVDYNLKSKTGIVRNMEFSKKPWYFKGESIERTDEKNACVNSGFATTCKFMDHPHYRLVSKKIHIELDEKVESWDVLFYIGDIPIFYFPYIYRSLKKSSKSPLTVKPGYTTTEGFFIKSSFNYDFSEYLFGSILFDYMANKGFGYGLQQNYRFKDSDSGGYLYTYYIQEKDTGHARWRIDLDHKNYLAEDISLMGRVNYLSDELVTRDFSQYYYPVNLREIRSYLALTKHSRDYTLIVSAERQDKWDENENKYFENAVYLPTVKFQTSSMRIFDTPFYASFSSELTNYYFHNTIEPTNSYYILRIGVMPTLTYSFAFFPGHTLSSSFAFSETWRDKSDYGIENNGFNASYSTTINLHNAWNSYFETDLSHLFSQRLTNIENDQFNGISLNKLQARLTFRIRNLFTNVTTTGYDLRPTNTDFINKFDVIYNNTNIIFSEDADGLINTQYSLAQSKVRSVDAYANLGRAKDLTIGLGLNFVDNTPYMNVVDVNSSLGFNLTSDVRLEFSSKYDTSQNILKEIRTAISANLTDCWYGNLSLLKSWNNISFSFNFQLRAFKESELDKKLSPELFKY
ncbi:MAG: LptA/OstA family protein [Candidatus Firestonebacteria bacterium]